MQMPGDELHAEDVVEILCHLYHISSTEMFCDVRLHSNLYTELNLNLVGCAHML